MTGSADPICDPVGTVVDLVAAADPALDTEEIRRIVERVGGGRAKRRRLATALACSPRVLTTGRSPAPKVVGDLLLALRAAGAARISPPGCADCGREITSMQRRGEHWYCCPCFLLPQQCASCGQQRQVSFRDRHGRPRCSQCPDRDARDPRRVLVEVITSVDPGLTADAVVTAIVATVTKPAHEQKLAWAIEETPELLTGGGAKAPFPMVLKLIDALCDVGASHIRRPACPRCGRVVTLSKTRDGGRICRNCTAKANAVSCSRCGTVREPAARDDSGKPLCAKCLVTDPVNLEQCIHCRRRRRVSSRSADGPVCATCVPRRTAICSMCGRTAPCIVSTTTGQPRCGACARSWACCSRCGQSATVRAGTREVPLCGHCAIPDPSFWKTCPRCGADGRLTSGVCSRCHLHQQLQTLLTDTTGEIRFELRALHETLAGVDRPATALNWLKHPTVRSALTDLASGQRPLSHAALDDLTPSKPIEHLRSVLVAAAALPARDEHLARIERWVTDTLNEHRPPDEKELLHRYAVWHVLRRLRQRNHGADTTYGQLDLVRRRVRAAIGLLDWLRGRGLTLITCRQADLDTWLTSEDVSHRAEAGHFVRWAISQRLNRNLRFAATRWTGPAGPLDQEERWHQAKRLLHDHNLDTDDRVAGLLLLLYAQRPATISRLTVDDIDTNDDTVQLRFGSVPIVLPEPLSTLGRELVTTRRGHAVLGDQGASPWLFPGGQPRRPISADRLGHRLRLIGLHPAEARSTALFQLATELPAAVLARMLNSYYRRHRRSPPPQRPAPLPHQDRPQPRALSESERAAILDELHSERFVDMSPTEVWATLLDEGRYLGSISTFYRLLRQAGESRERRRQATHPATVKPELVAYQPNSVWSWDITKLRGPAKWSWYYLYVILDIFSRYVVGWMVATRESAALAEVLIRQTCAKQGIGRDQLTIHADRGSSMTSKPVAFLLADLGVTQSHSRPHVSDDNPFSEAQFKTLKYRPDFPDRFNSIEAARRHCQTFFGWYNNEHRHTGLGLHVPADVHYGTAAITRDKRAGVLDAAYAAHPERFVRKPPEPPNLPSGSWINKPDDTEEAAQ